jgi:hypothetical protein
MEEIEQVVHLAHDFEARVGLCHADGLGIWFGSKMLEAKAPKAPTSRPVWLTVLTSSMLVYGGVTLVSALLMLREPRAMAVMAIENMTRPAESAAESTETVQKLEALSSAIVERYKPAVRAGALISLGVALLTLYTVAALLSRDPHGRKLAMVTAVVGIVYQLGGLPLGVVMAHRAATEGGPLLSQIVIDSGREPPGFTAAQLPHLLVVPAILAGLLGALACLVLLYYFGGRRGRALYGLDSPRRDQH